MRRRHELTDEQWEKIKDHLPGKADDPGRTMVVCALACRQMGTAGTSWGRRAVGNPLRQANSHFVGIN